MNANASFNFLNSLKGNFSNLKGTLKLDFHTFSCDVTDIKLSEKFSGNMASDKINVNDVVHILPLQGSIPYDWNF